MLTLYTEYHVQVFTFGAFKNLTDNISLKVILMVDI
jgi:hypothetical protein